jgi:hypothetical protein
VLADPVYDRLGFDKILTLDTRCILDMMMENAIAVLEALG